MKLYAFDTETHLIQPGLLTPPLVLASVASEVENDERCIGKGEAREVFRRILTEENATIGGANLVYDFGVMSADDPRVVDLIFKVLDDGRAFDTAILETLHDNARGHIFKNPNGSPCYYGLVDLEQRYLGIDRSDEKADGWRLRYAELDNIPIAELPDEAVQYPRRDARGTFEVLRHQLGPGKRLHEYNGEGTCTLCGEKVPFGTDTACAKAEITTTRFNVQCIAQEMRAAWFLHLACIWGMRTDPEMVPGVVADIRAKHEESRRKFFAAGIVRVRKCTKKQGEYERADAIGVEFLEAMKSALKKQPAEWAIRRLGDIEACRKALAKGQPIRFAEDKGRLKELVEAAYFADPPLTSGGESGNQQTSTSYDTLSESADELLEEYAEAGANEKLYSTYVKVLEQGTKVPINPSANVMVATQRTSYRKPNLQQLPRKGAIRSCFVPRGYTYEEIE